MQLQQRTVRQQVESMGAAYDVPNLLPWGLLGQTIRFGRFAPAQAAASGWITGEITPVSVG